MRPQEVRSTGTAVAPTNNDTPAVAIVGGGIAGLALAGFLRRTDWQPIVIERTAEWDRVGWGIGRWANGLAVLAALGVAETAIDRGRLADRFEIRTGDGRLAAVDLPDEAAFLAVHRADLHAALRAAVPAEVIRMDTTPTAITRADDRDGDDDGIVITDDDGRVEHVDAVIGADGIGSSVRDLWFDAWTVEDAGTAVWSFWTDPDDTGVDMDGSATVSYWGQGTEAFVVDIDGRRLVNVATRLPVEETPAPPARDRLATVAAEIGGPLPSLVAGIDDDATVFFDRNRTVRADRWHRGRVALIGDAAHAVHPISGMGAALALEDAYVLAEELTAADAVEAALAAFERRRRDRVETVKRTAAVERAAAFAEVPLVTTVRDALVRWTPAVEWFMQRRLDDLLEAPLASL